MSTWPIELVIIALLGAIFVPAILIHFTIGRNGGHHFFKDVPDSEIKKLPFKMAGRFARSDAMGSFGTLIGVAIAVIVYPLSCRLGAPINVFGLSQEQLTTLIIVGVGFLVLLLFRLFRIKI